MAARVRIHEEEYQLMRRRFLQVGNNWQMIVYFVKQDVENGAVPEEVKNLWRRNTDKQLRRRVKDTMKARVQEANDQRMRYANRRNPEVRRQDALGGAVLAERTMSTQAQPIQPLLANLHEQPNHQQHRDLPNPLEQPRDEPDIPNLPEQPRGEPDLPNPPEQPRDEPDLPNLPEQPLDMPELPNPPEQPHVEPDLPNPPEQPRDEPDFPNPPEQPRDMPELPNPQEPRRQPLNQLVRQNQQLPTASCHEFMTNQMPQRLQRLDRLMEILERDLIN